MFKFECSFVLTPNRGEISMIQYEASSPIDAISFPSSLRLNRRNMVVAMQSSLKILYNVSNVT